MNQTQERCEAARRLREELRQGDHQTEEPRPPSAYDENIQLRLEVISRRVERVVPALRPRVARLTGFGYRLLLHLGSRTPISATIREAEMLAAMLRLAYDAGYEDGCSGKERAYEQ